MSGFLGVLEPPAPAGHLGQGIDAATVPGWFPALVEELDGRLAGQEQVLSEILKMAGRISAGAERLRRGADRICERTSAKEKSHMKKAKAAVRNGTTPKVDWKDWVHTNATTNGSALDGSDSLAAKCEADPLHESIARLAYALWEARGCQGGTPEEDWFRAELEIRASLAARIGED